jgi:hypothetical protein
MAEDRQTGSGFTGGNWVLLAAAAVGTFYVSLHKPPLEGSRPAATLEFEAQDRDSLQHVDARLWQDPLAAAVQHARAEEKEDQAQKNPGGHDRNATLEEDRQSHSIQKLKGQIEKRDPLILGILVPGGPHVEDGEARLRLRYAVVAALNVAKFIPYDEDHIGYVDTKAGVQEPTASMLVGVSATRKGPPTPPRQEIAGSGWRSIPDIIPFEWFHKGNYLDESPTVLLLWIDERALLTNPISTLADLRCQIDPWSLNGPHQGFVIIGPQQSRTLARMAHNLHYNDWPPPADCEDKQRTSVLNNLFVYNPSATTKEKLLLNEAKLPDSSSMKQIFNNKEIHYYRTIGTDDALAQSLAAELKLRQVDPGADHIALVSEWDTVYGRTLPEVVEACFRKPDCEGGAPSPGESRIHKFSYLRGLDGQLPHGKSADTDTIPDRGSGDKAVTRARDQTADSPGDAASDRERAQGRGQFDYLRRLADHIQTLDRTLQREGKGKIKAIGILGSDVYDKLVILQALRPEFPEARFFTNDLDQLLLPQEKTRQTRDLLVASSFGLSLRDELQNAIPPFRNTYQTSAFFATQLALRNAVTTDTPSDQRTTLDEEWLQSRLKPRLFEIGRTDAHELPIDPRHSEGGQTDKVLKKDSAACMVDIFQCDYVNPIEGKLFPEFTAGVTAKAGVASFIAIALVALALCARGGRKFVMGSVPVGQPLVGLTLQRLGHSLIILASASIFAATIVIWWPWIGDTLT